MLLSLLLLELFCLNKVGCCQDDDRVAVGVAVDAAVVAHGVGDGVDDVVLCSLLLLLPTIACRLSFVVVVVAAILLWVFIDEFIFTFVLFKFVDADDGVDICVVVAVVELFELFEMLELLFCKEYME